MAATSQKVNDMLDDTPEHETEPPRPLFAPVPPAEQYPVEALGPVLGPAAQAIHSCIQAPLAICAQSVLAAAALAVQGHADIELPYGQSRPVSLYLVSVAESGERKSSVDALALMPVRIHEEALNRIHQTEQAQYRNDKAIWDSTRASALNAARAKGEDARVAAAEAIGDLGPEPQPPLSSMLTCDDPTYEGLVKYMVNAHPSLGIFSAEGGQFVGGHGMKEENRVKTAAGLSNTWDGEPARRVRAGDEALYLPGRRVSMHLMVQPGIAKQLLSDAVLADQGLLSRLLVTAPPSTAGTRMFRQPDSAVEADIARYTARMRTCMQHPLPLAARNELKPRLLPLAPLARDMWVGFHDKVESQVGVDGPLYPVRAFANKLAEHSARLAGVLALAEDLGCREVNEQVMGQAIILAQYYLSEAIRLRLAAQVPQELADAQCLLDWLRKWPEAFISMTEILQGGPNKLRQKKKTEPLIRILIEHGHLIPAPAGTLVNGKPHKEPWRIIPVEG